MGNYIKIGLSTLLFAALAPVASAQSSDYASDAVLFGSSDPFQNVGLNAGFNLTVPLGAKPSKTKTDKARIGLKLTLTQSNYYTSSPQHFKLNGDLLELGFNFDGTPNLQMYGQDIYTPLFRPIYADENEDNQDSPNTPKPKSGTGGALLAVGGLAILGSVVLINEAADDFSDCFRLFGSSDDPKCN